MHLAMQHNLYIYTPPVALMKLCKYCLKIKILLQIPHPVILIRSLHVRQPNPLILRRPGDRIFEENPSAICP